MSKRRQQLQFAGFEDAPAIPSPPSRASDSEDSVRPLRPEATATESEPAAWKADVAWDESGEPQLAGRTVYVIDAHALLYQLFHALPEMTTPAGLPIAAVHGFTRDLVDLIERRRPDFLFCAFDEPGENFRNELFQEYKGHREEMPPDLQLQIPLARKMLAALGVPALGLAGYEADDILAKVARVTDRLGGECFLVTNDKDCRQLITDRVRMLNVRKNEIFDAAALDATWGIRPDQVVDFQALVGDSVDNVPGVPQIGPKAARDLLAQFGTLDAMYERLSEIQAQRRRDLVSTHREQALLSRELVRLRDDVPIDIPWSAGRAGQFRPTEVLQLCDEFGFRRLGERLAQLAAVQAETAPTATYRSITTVAELRELAESLRGIKRLSIDTETTSERPRWAELVGVSLAWQGGAGVYIPVRAPAGEPRLEAAEVLAALRPVLEDAQVEKVGQNLKYDLIVFRAAGIDVQGVAFDTMVADYLIDPGARVHNLDHLAQRYLGHQTITIESLIGTGKRQKRMDEVPLELITNYAAEDADVALRLAQTLEPRLRTEELWELFRDVEVPLVEVLAELEFNGIRIDSERLRGLSDRFANELARLEVEIYALAGDTFNIDSPAQMAKVLFERLGLPIVKRTKTGPSTDAEVLAELAPLHALPAKVIEYRQVAKLKSTYVDTLPELVCPATGRVHTSFKQDVAATGRLSSTDPNLQNIPVRTEAGREIRGAFLPGEEGWRLVAADYSQIELRVLAHFSEDATLREAFANNEDIHTRVAGEVHGVPADQVTREMRRAAKAVNFGVIYGQGAAGLAQAIDVTKDEAARFIEAYFARYPGVGAFMERTLEAARGNGYVSTILGRRRAIQGIRPPSQRGDSRQRNLPERIAINTVIQGSAADLIKLAMIRIHQRLKREGLAARMLLQIHDELVFEAPEREVDSLSALVRDEMIRVGQVAVPLQVSVKVGANWADCEER